MAEENKYEKVVERLVKECGFSKTPEEYEACCQKADSQCSVESNPFRPREASTQEIAILVSLVICILVAVFFIFKSGFYKRALPPYSRNIKAIVTGWLIWCFCVFSYSKLFDTWVEFRFWFTLPPICAIAIFYWFSKYVQKKP